MNKEEIDKEIAFALEAHREFLVNKNRPVTSLKDLYDNEPEKMEESHPDLICIYLPEADCDLVYSTEAWLDDLECEQCGRIGSYYMVNEKYKVGACRIHISETGQFAKIIELPEGHSYYAMDIESGRD